MVGEKEDILFLLNKIDPMDLLIKYGEKDQDGCIPLHYASARPNVKFCKLLLNYIMNFFCDNIRAVYNIFIYYYL